MYEDSCYYDTHDPAGHGEGGDGDNNSLEENIKLSTTFSLEDLSSNHQHHQEPGMDYELENELKTHLMQEQVLHDPSEQQQNWDMQDMSSCPQQQQYQVLVNNGHDPASGFGHHQQIDLHCFNNSTPFANHPPPPYAPTPDLLNLFHLPRCSVLPTSSSISFNKKHHQQISSSLDIFGGELPPPPPPQSDTSASSNILYDPPLHLNLPPQQTPIFKELFHYSLPHNYGLPGGSRGGSSTSFFGSGMDDRDQLLAGSAVYQEGDNGRQYENSTLDFSRDMSTVFSGKRGADGNLKGGNGTAGRHHFATERQRREQLNDKYKALRQLVPNPTKGDRASIVHDAIEYIKELLRTVDELKILVDKKRDGRDRCKRLKTEEDPATATAATGDMESSSKPLTEREQCSSNNGKRSTWVQRKLKETEVDVRIIHDEVTIKLIQRKKMNCLLSVSKILDELQLDLLHVSGGNIGESYSFLFNAKIYEGSSVYAYAIANKLTEAVDKNSFSTW